MSRRHATILASVLLLIGMLSAVAVVRIPYSELSPGPTVNTLGEYGGEPVLSIDGRESFDTTGHLNMTTVRVTSADYRMTLGEALYGWLADDAAVVPHDSLYPDGTTAEEAEEENAEEFSRSQESAKVAALGELDIPVETRTVVQAVIKDGPAEGTLRAGDVIKTVDGTPVQAPADVAKLVTEHEPGEQVIFTVVPVKTATAAEEAGEDPAEGATREVTVTTTAAEEDGRALVGIQAGTAHTFPFDIDIQLADVGGPSAGLMFALGIVDKLTPEDLTGGTFVAGTGTINGQGEVGPIGGITMKTRAAEEAGARYFLTPAANCATAAADRPGNLTLVKVGSMDDAMAALKDIREDTTDALPRCAAN
ncbi:PDZ domain-containing protein [Streptomyces sp. JJ66]|uniref:YlbL family protein n=1 Tax=Streptomyces sp. JJ66 TaxID=2803843 RepID=UPI001C56CA5F|nr:PDZ domain-containing protein [Streptomyces sp. JJ66]MBW1603002.1 PDZ domain-containing protein [Streptomyces sp. JJ66]